MTSDKRKALIKNIIVTGLSVLLAAAFLYFAFSGVDFAAFLDIIAGASLLWLVIFVLLQTLSHIFRAVRWKIILASINPDISVNTLFGALMMGYGISGVIPRFGEITRAVTVGKLEEVSTSSVFGTIIVERMIDLFFFAGAVLLSGFLYGDELYAGFPWLKSALLIGAAAFFGGIIIFVLSIRFEELFYRALDATAGKISETFAEKLKAFIKRLNAGFASLKTVRSYLLVIGCSIIIMGVYVSVSWSAFYLLHMEHLIEPNFVNALVVFSISAIGMMIPTPGGIGSFHTITKSVLTGLFGLGGAISIAYATAVHGIGYILNIALTVGYALYWKNRLTTIENEVLKTIED